MFLAAQELGVDVPRTIMAVNYGETWTTLVQPFWALLFMPIMGAGLKLSVKDFLGYLFDINHYWNLLDYRSHLFYQFQSISSSSRIKVKGIREYCVI